jgi:hypothetical protein
MTDIHPELGAEDVMRPDWPWEILSDEGTPTLVESHALWIQATICDQGRDGRSETGLADLVACESQDMTVLAHISLPLPLRSLPQSPEWIGA